MGGYIVLIGAFILAVYIIFFFASKSVAKDKGVTTDAVTKQAALGDYNTEDNLPKEIVLLIAGLGMFGVDFFYPSLGAKPPPSGGPFKKNQSAGTIRG